MGLDMSLPGEVGGGGGGGSADQPLYLRSLISASLFAFGKYHIKTYYRLNFTILARPCS